MVEALVVGGGISGLAYAHSRGGDVLVLEAAGRAGGLVRTRTQDGFRWEEGPEVLAGTARATRELVEELGLARLAGRVREAASS